MGVSKKRLLGWEPSELHQHFDAAGRASGFTLVKFEPEWDDVSRDEMLGLVQYEAGICACGFHSSLTHDKANHFTWDDDVCPVCKGSAQWSRIQASNDEAAMKPLGDQPPPNAPRPDDGRRTWTRLMTAAEVEARRATQAERRSRS